jgi:hypothetical protein
MRYMSSRDGMLPIMNSRSFSMLPIMDSRSFSEWLHDPAQDDATYPTCHVADCPIARYLRAMTGMNWEVGYGIRSIFGHNSIVLPKWAIEFVARLAGLSVAGDRRIPAAIARKVLAQVVEGC